ncbi:MAG: hypothetical protein AAB662_04225 [Patescibacteria group bacterium]
MNPEKPFDPKGVYGMAVDPKGDFPKHPVDIAGKIDSLPPIPFPETKIPSGNTISDSFRAAYAEKSEPPKRALRERLAGVLKSRILHIGLGLGVAAGAGYAISEVYQNIPAVHQQVDNVPGYRVPEIIPSTFDPNADKGVIVPGINAKVMTLSEYEALKIPFSEKDKVTEGLFVKFPDGLIPTINYQRLIPVERKINISVPDPNNPIKTTVEKTEKVVANGYRLTWTTAGNAVESGLPIVFSPIDGMIDFTHSQIFENPDGTLKAVSIYLSSTDEKGNLTTFHIDAQDIKPLIPSSAFIVKGNTSSSAPAYPIKKGTSIFEFTNKDNTKGLAIRAISNRVDDGIRTGGYQNLNLGVTAGDSGNTVAILLKPE